MSAAQEAKLKEIWDKSFDAQSHVDHALSYLHSEGRLSEDDCIILCDAIAAHRADRWGRELKTLLYDQEK